MTNTTTAPEFHERRSQSAHTTPAADADAKRLAELEAALFAYASEFPLNADGEPDVGSIHENIRKLKKQVATSELCAAAPNSSELEPVASSEGV